MQRPEPLLAMFCMSAIFYGGRIFAMGETRMSTFVKFGSAMGLALLTRQWGIFILAGLFVGFAFWVAEKRSELGRLLPRLGLAVLVSILVAGWFYALLSMKCGSVVVGPENLKEAAARSKGTEFYTVLQPGIFSQTNSVGAWESILADLDFRDIR